MRADGRREAERWLERAEQTLRAELEPAVGLSLHWARAGLELARGRPERALDAFRAAERLAELLRTVRTHMRHIYDKLGAHRRAEAIEHARTLGLLAPSSRIG